MNSKSLPELHLSFWEHLEELRRRLLISLAAVGVGAVAAYAYSERALRALVAPLRDAAGAVYFFSPQEAFVVRIKVALLLGAVAASPVVLSQVWLFVSPGLHGKEKRALVPLVTVTTGLFLAGASFCYFLVMPVALKFLVGMQTDFLRPMISVGEYVSFLSTMMLAFGVAFNLPAFILALAAAGVVTAATLSKYRRHAIVAIVIAAAVLTPGPDIASQLLLAFPMYALFEIGVLGSRLVEKRRRQRA